MCMQSYHQVHSGVIREAKTRGDAPVLQHLRVRNLSSSPVRKTVVLAVA